MLDHGKIHLRQHRQGDVPVPAISPAHFVLVQPPTCPLASSKHFSMARRVPATLASYSRVVLAVPAPATGCAVAAVDRISSHSAKGHSPFHRPLQHQRRQLRLGPKGNVLRHPGLTVPLPLLRPYLGKVQLPVQHGPPLGDSIGQEYASLTALAPPRRAAVPTLHLKRLVPLLEESRSRPPPEPPPRRPDAPPAGKPIDYLCCNLIVFLVCFVLFVLLSTLIVTKPRVL